MSENSEVRNQESEVLKFAKLIDLPDGSQVLLTKDIDEEEEYIVVLQTYMAGGVIKMTFGYGDSESKADEFMNSFTEEQAIKFRKNFNGAFVKKSQNSVKSNQPSECPECLEIVYQNELDMFGGLCEECSGAFND